MLQNNQIRFNSGLYSKAAYDIFNAILYFELFDAWHRRKQSFLNYHKQYLSENFPTKESHLIQYRTHNKVMIFDNGEIGFIANTYGKSTKISDRRRPTLIKIINVLNELKDVELPIDNPICKELQTKYPDINDGIDLIIRYYKHKLTSEDIKSNLYRKYIGEPLNPFESEIMKFDKEKLCEELERFNEMPFKDVYDEIPKDFWSDADGADRLNWWIDYNLDSLFDKYFSHLS